MTGLPRTGYRWRAMTPQQGEACRRALDGGASVAALAASHGVHRRTVYRAIERARNQRIHDVEIEGYRASYEMTDEGPVQVTPWVPIG